MKEYREWFVDQGTSANDEDFNKAVRLGHCPPLFGHAKFEEIISDVL